MPSGNVTKRVLISVIGIPIILAASYLGSAFFFTFVLTSIAYS